MATLIFLASEASKCLSEKGNKRLHTSNASNKNYIDKSFKRFFFSNTISVFWGSKLCSGVNVIIMDSKTMAWSDSRLKSL